jgi:hypothetical protein
MARAEHMSEDTSRSHSGGDTDPDSSQCTGHKCGPNHDTCTVHCINLKQADVAGKVTVLALALTLNTYYMIVFLMTIEKGSFESTPLAWLLYRSLYE